MRRKKPAVAAPPAVDPLMREVATAICLQIYPGGRCPCKTAPGVCDHMRKAAEVAISRVIEHTVQNMRGDKW